MINILKAQKVIERRFNEVFLIDIESLSTEDFDYYIKRIADFYEYTKNRHPDFFDQINAKIKLIDDRLQNENQEINKYFKKLEPIIDSLSQNPDFMTIVKKGEEIHRSYVGSGVHSMGREESIYFDYERSLKVLKSDEQEINLTLGESKNICIDLSSLIRSLVEIKKTRWIKKYKTLSKTNEKIIGTLNQAEEKANRLYDYARTTSIQEIEGIWQYYYRNIEGFSKISLKLHIARESFKGTSRGEMFSAKRVCGELKIDLQRFYYEFLDWLEEQNFLEEAFINFRLWVEVVNNDYFKGIEGVDEKKLKIEFSKYLFSVCNVLVIREPDFLTKKPDFFLNLSNKKIIGEAKFLKVGLNEKKALDVIKQGIKQINNYSKLFPYMDGFVLVVFNYNEKIELTSEIITEIYKDKPLTILPINVNVLPSDSKIVSYTSGDIKDVLASL